MSNNKETLNYKFLASSIPPDETIKAIQSLLKNISPDIIALANEAQSFVRTITPDVVNFINDAYAIYNYLKPAIEESIKQVALLSQTINNLDVKNIDSLKNSENLQPSILELSDSTLDLLNNISNDSNIINPDEVAPLIDEVSVINENIKTNKFSIEVWIATISTLITIFLFILGQISDGETTKQIQNSVYIEEKQLKIDEERNQLLKENNHKIDKIIEILESNSK